MNQILFPLKKWIDRQNISERSLAEQIGLSRLSIRALYKYDANFNVKTLFRLAKYFEQEVTILSHSTGGVDANTCAASYCILRDGFDSWQIHLMDMVDEFRKHLDMRVLVLPPCKESDPRIKALLASCVLQLCEEAKVSAPTWAQQNYFLKTPWFVSEVESLKAFALLEAPLTFRKNNIFVLNNFLQRA